MLTIGATTSTVTRIAVDKQQALGSCSALVFEVKGRALSAATVVSMETAFYNSAGALIASHTDQLHSGSGFFDVGKLKTNIPASAAKWRPRLAVSKDAAVFGEVTARCATAQEQDPEHGCSECSEDCGDYTALGWECPQFPCTAECDGELFEDNYEFHPHVAL